MVAFMESWVYTGAFYRIYGSASITELASLGARAVNYYRAREYGQVLE